MVQSLVNDAQQGGWLPKWAIVDGDASQMNGDSADPIIASAYAFGVRGFDVRAALQEMVKGATQAETGTGWRSSAST
jgi:putative alpha-1,2-mannosidase